MTDGERPTAVEQAAAALRLEILSGALALGAPLREEHLAARLAVSRHTVRTALALLAGTGLVESVPYRGTRVTAFDAGRAAALQDLRRALESEAVAILAERHGDGPWPAQVLARTTAAIEALEGAEATGDEVAVLTAHAAVHRELVAAADSGLITEAHARLTDQLHVLLLRARPAYSPGELGRQHRDLLGAVQAAGPAAIRAHLADTLDRLEGMDVAARA